MQDHLGPDDEIASIRAQLRELDDAARAIVNKRAALLRRLNEVQSKTAVLPPETLSLIFQYVITPTVEFDDGLYYNKRDPSPIFFGSISYTWRRVAWSTPQLWTTLYRVLHTNKAERFALLLGLYSTNIRDLTITLGIEFFHVHEYFKDCENDPVAQILFKAENSRKLGVLKLRYLPSGWLSLLDRPFLQLAEICLQGGNNTLNAASITNAPMLRKISLGRIEPPLTVPSQVTTFYLKYVSTASALRYLVESSGLTEFYYQYPHIHSEGEFEDEDSRERQWDPPELSDAFTLHHLEVLEWPFTPDNRSDLFFHQIRLPALRTLTWNQREIPLAGPFSPGIWRFFGNLSVAPLTTLCVQNMFDADIALLRHIYHKNPLVEKLQLEGCNEKTLWAVLGSLIPGWGGEGSADECQHLTELKELGIGYCKSGRSGVPILGESFGDIIADLLIWRASAVSASTLTINSETRIEWGPETKERLREFNCVGGQVRLLLRGEQLDWL